jgi:hypothetical protein
MPSRIKRPNELIRVDCGECGLPNRFVRARLRESWMSASAKVGCLLLSASVVVTPKEKPQPLPIAAEVN